MPAYSYANRRDWRLLALRMDDHTQYFTFFQFARTAPMKMPHSPHHWLVAAIVALLALLTLSEAWGLVGLNGPQMALPYANR